MRRIAVRLFSAVERLPIVSPHGHRIRLASRATTFGGCGQLVAVARSLLVANVDEPTMYAGDVYDTAVGLRTFHYPPHRCGF